MPEISDDSLIHNITGCHLPLPHSLWAAQYLDTCEQALKQHNVNWGAAINAEEACLGIGWRQEIETLEQEHACAAEEEEILQHMDS